MSKQTVFKKVMVSSQVAKQTVEEYLDLTASDMTAKDFEEIDPDNKYCTHPMPDVVPKIGWENSIIGEECRACGKTINEDLDFLKNLVKSKGDKYILNKLK